MAIVKFNGKTVDGVASIKIKDKKDNKSIGVVCCICYTGELINIEFNKCEYIRVECKSDLQELCSTNVATVIGNVNYTNVGNCLFIEGFLKDYNKNDNKYVVDKVTRVCYGRERYIRENIELQHKVKVLHIDGQLLRLGVDITNQGIETVIFGNVVSADIGNCFYVRGFVNNCVVGNKIFCSEGKAIVPNLEELQRKRKENCMNFTSFFDDFSKNFVKSNQRG